MKYCLLYIIFLVSTSLKVFSQSEFYSINPGETPSKVIPKSDQYALPNFVKGKAYYWDGSVGGSVMNYNTLYEEMFFINETKDTLAVKNPGEIKLFSLGNDYFYYDKVYLQHTAKHDKYILAERVYFALSDVKKPGAMGKSTSTVSVENVKVDFSKAADAVGGYIAQEYLTLTKKNQFYLGDENLRFKPITKSNLSKIAKSEKAKNQLNKGINLKSKEELKSLFANL